VGVSSIKATEIPKSTRKRTKTPIPETLPYLAVIFLQSPETGMLIFRDRLNKKATIRPCAGLAVPLNGPLPEKRRPLARRRATVFAEGFPMAVPKKKTSPSRRGMRRAHDRLANPTYVEDRESGELRRPHHIDLKSGRYKGRKVLEPKGE